MSIKGSSSKLKIEFIFPVFIVASIVAIVLRIYQCLNIIEPETGFFKEENISVIWFYAILAVAGIIIFAFSYLAKKVPLSTLPEGRNIPLAIASVFFSTTFITDALKQANDTLFKVYVTDPQSISQMNRGLADYIKSGYAPKVLEAVFAAFCAVYFIMFAVRFFGGPANVSNRKVLAVTPVFWATMRMIQRFTRTISFIFVSDLLLELFMIAFMMMFFLSFAQLASDVNSRHVVNKIYSYGLIGAMMAAVVSIPRLAVSIVDASLIVSSNPFEMCDLGFVVFAVVFCFALAKMPREDNVTLKEVEKLKKQREEEKEN